MHGLRKCNRLIMECESVCVWGVGVYGVWECISLEGLVILILLCYLGMLCYFMLRYDVIL